MRRKLPQLGLAADQLGRADVGAEQFDQRFRIGFSGVQTGEPELRAGADDLNRVAVARDLHRNRPGSRGLRLPFHASHLSKRPTRHATQNGLRKGLDLPAGGSGVVSCASSPQGRR
jgi:hypothetical protein